MIHSIDNSNCLSSPNARKSMDVLLLSSFNVKEMTARNKREREVLDPVRASSWPVPHCF